MPDPQPETTPDDWTPTPDPGPLAQSDYLEDLIDPETGKIK